jgi:3-oxoacyl-[acyl-carrier-protein] synthase II
MKRVVITGMDMITSLGKDKKISFSNIIKGKSGITKISNFDASNLAVQIAGEIKDFDPKDYISPKEIKKMDRFIQLGLKTAISAFDDANFTSSNINYNEFGIVSASAIGGLPRIEEETLILHNKGARKVSPFFIPSSLVNLLGGTVAIELGLKGPNLSSTTACAASNHAISQASRLIMSDEAKIMMVTASESTISPIGIVGFSALKSLSTNNENPSEASRPFDIHRNGFVMAEAAGTLILEEYEHAINRGAKIYAEIVGFGESGDAYHITTPSMDGPLRSMQKAFNMAKSKDKNFKLDYINAHATSTSIGDLNETAAIKELLKDENMPLVSSTKGATGHALGAAGMIESIITIMAMNKSILPPTINLKNPDIENGCDLDYIPNVAREDKVLYAMNNSFGFGGTNGTIIFKNMKEYL